MNADLPVKGCCGAWDINKVVRWINAYKGSTAQYKVNNVPFVSTFEGPTWADQWANVRSQTGGIYLVPDWSSLGPNGIAGQLGKIDGACKFIFWRVLMEEGGERCGVLRLSGLGRMSRDVRAAGALCKLVTSTFVYLLLLWFRCRLES